MSKGNLSLLLFPEVWRSRPTGILHSPGGGAGAGPADQVPGLLGAERLPSSSQVADEATGRWRDASAVRGRDRVTAGCSFPCAVLSGTPSLETRNELQRKLGES